MFKRFIVLCLLLFLGLTTSVAIAQDAPEDEPWWNERVFYEVFVRSFYDSDGDGIGDLQGLIEKLDYLNDGDPTTTTDLGVTGLWLMPIMNSPSYHGYDVTDYFTVNPDYGTNDDFKALMAEAHARGMVVIVDLVLNHTSSQHPWFLESQTPYSAYQDWYVWAEENPGYLGPEGQTVWHMKGDRYYYGLFWSEMPDLNYRNPDVNDEMLEVSRFWLEDMGADGFRLDAIRHLIERDRAQENTPETHTWLREYHDFVKAVKPEALMVGEVWASTALVAPYVPDEVDLAFEFDLAQAIVRSANLGITGSIINALETVLTSYPEGQYATFLTNHDQNRVMTLMRGNVGAAKVAASILLTLPGVPFIYYGEEIGMVGQKPDELIRTPMQWDSTLTTAGFTTGTPWQNVNADAAEVNVANQEADPDSLLNHYRALIQVRHATPTLQTGTFSLVESASRKVLSYLRQTDDQTVLVIINMDDRPVVDYGLTLPEGVESAELILGSGEVAAPVTGQLYEPTAELAPQSVMILELK